MHLTFFSIFDDTVNFDSLSFFFFYLVIAFFVRVWWSFIWCWYFSESMKGAVYLYLLRLRETHNALLLLSSSCFSASRVRNIEASHIRDFRLCHNLKSHICCDFLIPPNNGFGNFKEQLKCQSRVVLRPVFGLL